MLNKRIYQLAGLPRTGSTLLGSILSQNPEIYVTPTSPLYTLLVGINQQFITLNDQHTWDFDGFADRLFPKIIETFYETIPQSIIFDKHRGWGRNISDIKESINPNPKIIATIRPIAEIITSYLVLADKDPENFIDAHLKRAGCPIDNEARAHLLWTTYLNAPYESLKIGLETHPENILLIEYRDIVCRLDKTMQRIYQFCELDYFPHVGEAIENRCAESKDEAWGLKNLHTIRPRLDMQSKNPLAYLPQAAIDFFNKQDLVV